MFTVLSIFGTRPEAIKMAPVIRELEKFTDEIRSVVCSTGQHKEMVDQVCDIFDIQRDYDLGLMSENQSLPALTARLFAELEPVIDKVKPDWVLAQGDTTTAFTAGFMAYYEKVNFGHIEAGLRTGDRFHPFPEEVNRFVADGVSTLMFAPTSFSESALLREGHECKRILVTGNTVIDALLDASKMPYAWNEGPLSAVPDGKRIVLVTAHRRESFGEPIKDLCYAIRELANRFHNENIHFVFPVHLNPKVRQPVGEILEGIDNISLLPPLDYLSMVNVLKRATLVLTDSGGIQEEAPGLGVPVLVTRETTERPEGIAAGVVKLVGRSPLRIIEEVSTLLTDKNAYAALANARNPYGDGKASERIVDRLLGESGTENACQQDTPSLVMQESGI